MSISNPFGKECANVTHAYVNISGYYLCRRTLLGIMQEQGENTVEKEKKMFMMGFRGKREENDFSSSTIEVAPYISSELPECKDYINRFYSEEGIQGKE